MSISQLNKQQALREHCARLRKGLSEMHGKARVAARQGRINAAAEPLDSVKRRMPFPLQARLTATMGTHLSFSPMSGNNYLVPSTLLQYPRPPNTFTLLNYVTRKPLLINQFHFNYNASITQMPDNHLTHITEPPGEPPAHPAPAVGELWLIRIQAAADTEPKQTKILSCSILFHSFLF